MYFLDLAKITLRDNINLNEITDTEISNIINDEQFQDLNIKGAEIFFLLEAMKKIQRVLFFTPENITLFKTKCQPFVTRVCNLSFNTYTETDIEIFSDFLYYHTVYFEYFTNIMTDAMLQDIEDLEEKILDYDDYIVDHDAIWLAGEYLKTILIRLYDINFNNLEDISKPMLVINAMNDTMAERRTLQRTITSDIKIET